MRLPFASTDDETRAGDALSTTDADPATTLRRAAGIAEGSKGGFVATLVMTAFRLPISRSLPPTARFWTKFVSGGNPDDHLVPAVALHLLYGTAGGAAFGALAPGDSRRTSADEARENTRREALGLLLGVAYGLALSAFGERVVLERVLDMNLESDERFVFHVGHLVYGLTLGTWMGSRSAPNR